MNELWSKSHILSKFARNEKGNFGILFALLSMPIIFSAGMAIDYARLVSFEKKAQGALDLSLLAGMNTDGTFNKDRAEDFLYSNIELSGIETITDIEYEMVSSGEWNGTLNSNVGLFFGGIITPSYYDVTNTASVAANVASSTSEVQMGCIHTLSDQGNSFLQNSNAEVYGPNCVINVGSVLSSGRKTGFNSGFKLDVEKVCVSGQLSYDNRTSAEKNPEIVETNCETPGDFVKVAATDLANHDDVLDVKRSGLTVNNWRSFNSNEAVDAISVAYLQSYASDVSEPNEDIMAVIDANKKVLVLEPGRYKSVNFNSGNYTIILKPGLYYIEGTWNINGQDFIGDGVSMFFTGNGKLQPNSGMAPMLTAPKSGPFKGFLWWENPSQSSNANWTINDNKSYSYLKGMIYLPNRQYTLNSSAQATYNSTFIVDKMTINSGSKINFGEYDPTLVPEHPMFAPPKGETTSSSEGVAQLRLIK